MAYAILNVDPKPVTALRSEIPEALERIVAKALEKAAARRYTNAEALLADLQALKTASTAPSKEMKPVPSIVVLPFANMSADPEQEYFCDGIVEEVITDLSQVKALRVISRNSSMMLKGTQKDLRTIGRALSVQYVLDGSVRKAGDRLRITVQLIEARRGRHLWAEKYRVS